MSCKPYHLKPLNEPIMTSYSTYLQNNPESPLEHLEMSVLLCLIKSIQEVLVNLDDFRDIRVKISNNALRIHIECKKKVQKSVERAVGECYVCQHLTFEKKLSWILSN